MCKHKLLSRLQRATRFLALATLALASFACTGKPSGKDAPRSVLAEYVNRTMALKGPEDKAKLLPLTTGPAKKSLESLDDAGFKINFIDAHREFLSLKVRDERPLTPDRYSITYELSYKSHTPNSDDLVTIKKHAIMVKDPATGWLISEVQNLKTDIEHQNAVSF